MLAEEEGIVLDEVKVRTRRRWGRGQDRSLPYEVAEESVECRASVPDAAGWQPELLEERLDPAWQFSDIAGVALLHVFPEGEEAVHIEASVLRRYFWAARERK